MRLRQVIVLGSAGLAAISLACFFAVAADHKNDSPPDAGSIEDLERRISTLENVEPFVVVDRQGKKIFQVTSVGSASSATVFNASEQGVATMGATTDGGYFFVRTADGSNSARLIAEPQWTGLRASELVTEPETKDGKTEQVTHDVARFELGGASGGNYALKFPSAGGIVAGIGESKAGTGAVVVGNSQGQKRAAIFVGDDNKGLVGIYNAAGNAIVSFGEASGNTGGALVLGDATSDPKVKMGTNDNRYGVVMALPPGFPYVPKSGLPGSYMLGCAGGSACVP